MVLLRASGGQMDRYKNLALRLAPLVTPNLTQCIHDAYRSADVVKYHLLSQIILNSPLPRLPDHIYKSKCGTSCLIWMRPARFVADIPFLYVP
jgi:hypothetical protein